MNSDDFDLLYKKLTELDITNNNDSTTDNLNNTHINNTIHNSNSNTTNTHAFNFPFNQQQNLSQHQPLFQQSFKDPFNLPLELQGGVSEISSRRPSYAAESYTRTPNWSVGVQDLSFPPLPSNLAAPQSTNQHLQQQPSLQPSNFFNDFPTRRPSQQINFNPFYSDSQPHPQPQLHPSQSQPQSQSQSQHIPSDNSIRLENGLILKNQYIIASQDLKTLYLKTIKYFQNPSTTTNILNKLNNLLNDSVISKLIIFIKNINNISYNKLLTFVVNKNGKLDLLSYPNHSNIFLQKNDLVVVDGDRGKDLVMIIEPLVQLNFAILFNFVKKIEHLKSLTILDSSDNKFTNNNGGVHSTNLMASNIINSYLNEDNEFIITLPTKQVLRFATPHEVNKLNKKFLEEKKSFITCFNKIKELHLNSDLCLINVEYQFDFKKLIFYYFANFKRIDFRGLIKELFKIYKTRIWLCAVLPFNNAELYTIENSEVKSLDNLEKINDDYLPKEYEITNDQILNFSIENLPSPNYFHSINLENLINNLENDIKGNFYGFNNRSIKSNIKPNTNDKILSSFNPFGPNN